MAYFEYMGFIVSMSDIALTGLKLVQSFVVAQGMAQAESITETMTHDAPSATLVQMSPEDDGYRGNLIYDSWEALPPELREHFATMAHRTRHQVCEIANEAINMLNGLEAGALKYKSVKETTGVVILENLKDPTQTFDMTGAHVHAMMQYNGAENFLEKLQEYLPDEAIISLGQQAMMGVTGMFLNQFRAETDLRFPVIPIISPCFGG